MYYMLLHIAIFEISRANYISQASTSFVYRLLT